MRIADDLHTSTDTLTESIVRATIERYEATGIVDSQPNKPCAKLMSELDQELMLAIMAEQP